MKRSHNAWSGIKMELHETQWQLIKLCMKWNFYAMTSGKIKGNDKGSWSGIELALYNIY